MTDSNQDTRQAHWERIYRERDAHKVSWYQPLPDVSLALIAKLPTPSPARVLDVGGGASTLVDELVRLGDYEVSVLDLSESALTHVRERLGENQSSVRWLCGDALTIDLGGTFHLWHDRAVFHFLTEATDRQTYLGQLREHLIPGGFAVIGTFAEDGPTRCSGLPVVRYSPEELASVLGRDFELIESRREVHTTPQEREQRFQWSVFQNRAEDT